MDKIEAIQVTEARLSEDGTRLHLTLLDQTGEKISLSLPTACLNTLITAMPGRVDPGPVHRLDSWTMNAADNGQELMLTLRTPEGIAVSFMLRPWQVEGMATIATYGNTQRLPPKMLH